MEFLTDREKAIVALLTTIRLTSDVEKNSRFSAHYKATLRARMMTKLHACYFPHLDQHETQLVFEIVPSLFHEMKETLVSMILNDAKSMSGFGLDKSLGSTDVNIHEDEEKVPDRRT